MPESLPMLQRTPFAILLLCLAVSAYGAGSTVYKVVDPRGNVTYQDHPPEPGTPDVRRLEVQPDQNVLKSAPAPETADPPVPAAPAPAPGAASAEQRRSEAAAIVRRALEAEQGAPSADAGEAVVQPLPASP